MNFENSVKTVLNSGKSVFGLATADQSELTGKLTINCQPDFLWIDLEHRSYGTYEVRWLPVLCRQAGVMPMIRVPGLDPMWAKKALDIGANTIMFPQINNAEEARLAVEYCKFPPEGTRGISPMWTIFMDIGWEDYLPAANQETAVVVQVESPEGMENLDEIAQVEGVDVVFAGPADLSASLGAIGNPEHPKVREYLAKFPEVTEKYGKAAGITFASIERCQESYDEGYRFINIGGLVHHGTAATKILADFRAKDGRE